MLRTSLTMLALLAVLSDPALAADTKAGARANPARRAELIAMTGMLQQEFDDARTRSGVFGEAGRNLTHCENAKDNLAQRRRTCEEAKASVERCNALVDSWNQRKATVLKEAEAENMLNLIPALPRMVLRACPYTLPNSFKSPMEALAEWEGESQGHERMVSNCDGIRRNLFAAIDNERLDQAKPLLSQFRASCSRELQTYDELEQLAASRMAALETTASTVQPPARPQPEIAELLDASIDKAERAARLREAEEARLQALSDEKTRKETAQREAAQAERQEAQSKQEKARQAFKDSLATMPVGQLYALADELGAQGKLAEAREALRSLVLRFPDHSLAPAAAKQMQTIAEAQQAAGERTAEGEAGAGNSNGKAPRQGGGGAGKGGAGADNAQAECARIEKEAEDDLERRSNAVAPNDNVGRMAVIYGMANRMSTALRSCNPGKADAYAQTAAGALATCRALASDASKCTQ